ncbi:MAG TPA: hydrogenase maturation protease [Acidimicrobiia bacterium]|nr:hydrogenase maturation protease [Acidimicrobiia bacterium]
MSRCLVIGMGNRDRGDDAAGILAAKLVSRVRAEEITDCSQLVTTWGDEDDVIVIDAMRSGAEPGTVTRFDGLTESLPSRSFSSTHSFGLAEGIELSRALGRLPRSLTVFGIEAGGFDHGSALTPEVERAVSQVAALVDEEVG